MKGVTQRSVELALKLADHKCVTINDIENAFREHEAEVRTDERARVLRKARAAIGTVLLVLRDDDPADAKTIAILKGLVDGLTEDGPLRRPQP